MEIHTAGNLRDVVSALKQATAAIEQNEPQEIKHIRSGSFAVGTNNQYFTTWDFANGMIRDHSMYTWYPLLKIFEDERFSLEQCCLLAQQFDYAYSNYLRYSGFPELGAFAACLIKHLPNAASRFEAVGAVRAFLAYLNRLASWSFHYFPWQIGAHLTYDAAAETSIERDPSRRVHIGEGKQVRLTWQPLGISVVAVLATNENGALCDDLLAALPFAVLQDHAVVSGQSIYAWAPIVSTAPVQVRERQCDAPIGRIRYSQGTGNKIVIQYGEVTEDIETPVLGEILPQYHQQLIEVGQAALKSTFETKELIFLHMEPLS